MAEFRLRKWRTQTPFDEEEVFRRRLAVEGLDEAEFLFILGQSGTSLKDCISPHPTWLGRIIRSFSGSSPLPKLQLPAGFQDPAGGLLQAVTPFLEEARLRLSDYIKHLCVAYPHAPLDLLPTVQILLQPLSTYLLYLLNRTLALELHITRMRGLLQGKSPATRFQSFTDRLRSPRIVRSLFKEYPVLARNVANSVDLWIECCQEMLLRLCQDWVLIRESFSPLQDPGLLDAVNLGVGDRHCGGRTVNILQFSSGFKVVYKPRSLAVQAHFNDLVQWIASKGLPALRVVNALDRGDYGWVQFVAAEGCDSPEAVHRFYRRQGYFLALFYALRGTDMHGENVIAAGEHPVIVDLEALFLPSFAEKGLGELVSGETFLGNSVMAVGLLPQWIRGRGNLLAFEFSGLGGKAGQVIAKNVPRWEARGTDEMKLSRGLGRLKGFSNLPQLHDKEVNAIEYTEQIVTGFREMYQCLLLNRDELLEEGGPLSWFANDEVRVVLRATRFYTMLIDDSLHPDVLRNSLDRERLFDRLWFGFNTWPAVLRDQIEKVIASERSDLCTGDIPYFHTSAAGRDLLDSRNNRIEAVVVDSGITMVRRRLLGFGYDDLERQVGLIRSSLAILSLNTEPTWPTKSNRQSQSIPSQERFLAAARKVGELLEKQALRSSREATWIGISRSDQGWQLAPLELDLYAGLPGVVLYLACLGKILHERRYKELGEAAWNVVQRKIDEQKTGLLPIGAFEGWGGIIYTMASLAKIWDRPDLLDQAVEVAELIRPLVENDDKLDVIGGSAGGIVTLLNLHKLLPSDLVLDTAVKCGDRLILRAQPQACGMGWTSPVSPNRALTGLSHGAAGIGWALCQLYEATREARFQQFANEAFLFERSVFDKEEANWPDLRENGGVGFMTAWCHGAPGIGISRLHLLRLSRNEEFRKEVESALFTTLSRGFGSNLSLCHGDLGNLEFIAQASRSFDRNWGRYLEKIGADILDTIEEDGYRCGVPLGVETPGLMVGLAGIGLGLLRLAEPSQVPCVLLLAGAHEVG